MSPVKLRFLFHFLCFWLKEEKKIATIQNVFGIIRGSEEPDRYVLLGNHRDAWTYGAVDPNSGTAALLDIARRYGLLLKLGWRPRRTIVLCSWDAEEFGMVGSLWCSLSIPSTMQILPYLYHNSQFFVNKRMVFYGLPFHR